MLEIIVFPFFIQVANYPFAKASVLSCPTLLQWIQYKADPVSPRIAYGVIFPALLE